MTDFIDRAKLEALANERSPHLSGVSKFLAVETFMAGVDATLALLDSETTEERASRIETLPGGGAGTVWYARKALHGPWVRTEFGNGPWLPSEGGEKP